MNAVHALSARSPFSPRAPERALRRVRSTLRLCLPWIVCVACDDGQALDDATTTVQAQTTAAPVTPRARQLALGRAHGCSLDPEISGLLCWGDNARGQTRVPALRAPRQVAAGGDVTCAISATGVTCWGDTSHGVRDVPPDLTNPTQVALGEAHACALTSGGAVRCWGENTAGQLAVPPLRNVEAIAAGARHTCALGASDVTCWGDDTLGQTRVPDLTAPTQIASGRAHSCAIDGSRVVCWGGDVPALRDAVPSVTAPTAIAAGGDHSCVIDAGKVACWGSDVAAGLAPRDLTRPVQLAVGSSGFACARHLQGVACWGDDRLGQTLYQGRPFHVLYRAQADIDAPAALIWDILVDLPNYGTWNPYTIAMQSTLQVGAPMVMTVKMNPLATLTQSENIRVLEPGYKACWGIETTTPELNSGERCQWLEPLPDGRTRYVTEDLIEGSLNGLVLALFDADLQRGFDAVASGLKTYAEQRAR